jgi:hypothetical protein
VPGYPLEPVLAHGGPQTERRPLRELPVALWLLAHPHGPSLTLRGRAYTAALVMRRFVWPIAIAAVVLGVAAGFFVGRETDTGKKTVTTSIGMSPAQLEEAKASEVAAGHVSASDVVKVFPPQILTDGDVAKEKKGSPGRVFLEWWQAYQWHDVAGVESLTSPETLSAVGRDNLAQLVQTQSLQGVEILGVSESGTTATVNAGLLQFQPPAPGKPPPNKPTSSQPDSFLMTNVNGKWLFADTESLQLKVDALQASLQQQ